MEEKEDPDNNWGYIITKIRDSGIGITSDKKLKLFNPFSDGAGITIEQQSLKKSGIGVGLSTAKDLCEALGGNVYLTS